METYRSIRFALIHSRDEYESCVFEALLSAKRDEIMVSAKKDVPENKGCQNMLKRFEKHGELYFTFITTPGMAAMNKTEREVYEKDLNDYWTYLASLETAEQKGIAKGRTEEAIKIARNMKDLGIDSAMIAQATELSSGEVANL